MPLHNSFTGLGRKPNPSKTQPDHVDMSVYLRRVEWLSKAGKLLTGDTRAAWDSLLNNWRFHIYLENVICLLLLDEFAWTCIYQLRTRGRPQGLVYHWVPLLFAIPDDIIFIINEIHKDPCVKFFIEALYNLQQQLEINIIAPVARDPRGLAPTLQIPVIQLSFSGDPSTQEPATPASTTLTEATSMTSGASVVSSSQESDTAQMFSPQRRARNRSPKMDPNTRHKCLYPGCNLPSFKSYQRWEGHFKSQHFGYACDNQDTWRNLVARVPPEGEDSVSVEKKTNRSAKKSASSRTSRKFEQNAGNHSYDDLSYNSAAYTFNGSDEMNYIGEHHQDQNSSQGSIFETDMNDSSISAMFVDVDMTPTLRFSQAYRNTSKQPGTNKLG